MGGFRMLRALGSLTGLRKALVVERGTFQGWFQDPGRPLGGSGVVMSKVTVGISHIRGLITRLTTTHEPPSSAGAGYCRGLLIRIGFWWFRIIIIR